MANDLVVRLNGDSKGFQDSINSAKQSLQGFQQEGSKLDQFQQRFDKVVNSAKPMKKQLADLRGLLAEMNKEGLNTSEVFTQIAQHAGSLADNIGDAQQAVKAFANDNFNLQASAEAFQVVAAGGALVTGAMAMMGVESQKTTEIIAKVQGAIALLNGVQTISNLLNKDSALMLKLKQIQMKINEAQTKKNTVAQTANNLSEATGKAQTLGSTTAEVANTSAKVANTTATSANTIAQNANNVAVAVGKALFGDFTGIALVAAAGLAIYAMTTSEATTQTEEATKATIQYSAEIQTLMNLQNAYSQCIGTATSELIDLKVQWKNLKTEEEKNDFIEENTNLFNAYGVSIENVVDAENFFGDNTTDFVSAIKARAMALAQLDRLKDSMAKMLDVEEKLGGKEVVSQLKGATAILTQEEIDWLNSQPNDTELWGVLNNTYYDDQGRTRLNGKGAYNYNAMIMARKYLTGYNNEATGGYTYTDYLHAKDEFDTRAADIDFSVYNTKKKTKQIQTPTTTDTTTTTTTQKEKPKTPLDYYGEYETQMRNLQKLMDVGITKPENAKKLAEQYAVEIKKILGENIVTIDLKFKTDTEIYNDIIQEFQNEKQRYDLGFISNEEILESANKVNTLLKEKFGENVKLVEVKLKPEIDDGSMSKLNEQIKEIEDKLQNINPNLHPEEYQQYISQLKKLIIEKEQLEEQLSLESRPTIRGLETNDYFETGSYDDKRQSYQNAQSTISQLQQDVELKIIGADEAMTIIDQINEKLKELGLNPIEIKVENGKLLTAEQSTENIIGYANTAASAFQSLGSAMQNLDQGGELAKAGLISSAIGQLVATFAASFKGTWSIWEWIAGAASGIATLTSVISQINKFEDGGIVGGSSYSGDKILGRLNSGEMILNKQQQSNLFNAISSGNLGSNMGGKVTFEIEGTKLKGVLNNFDRKMSKIR